MGWDGMGLEVGDKGKGNGWKLERGRQLAKAGPIHRSRFLLCHPAYRIIVFLLTVEFSQ